MAELKKRKNISTINGFLIIVGYILFLVILIFILNQFGILKFGGRHREGYLTKAHMATIENAIQKFHSNCGRYPDDSEGLEALIDAPSNVEAVWKGPYLKRSDLLDAWRKPYIYKKNDKNSSGFDIVTYGADGIPGGTRDNADIFND